MTRSEGLRLGSECLFSKFGFNDGDVPDELLDLLDERGIEHPDKVPPGGLWAEQEWHVVLRGLVRGLLVPMLPVKVETYDILTNHNPIRASSVNGIPVDDSNHESRGQAHTFNLVAVTVPWDQVVNQLLQLRREA